jgi:hypothetical protein
MSIRVVCQLKIETISVKFDMGGNMYKACLTNSNFVAWGTNKIRKLHEAQTEISLLPSGREMHFMNK